MTHDQYVAYIRERYSDLFDPTNTEQDWRYLITVGPGWWPLVEEYCEQAQSILRDHDQINSWYIRQVKEKFGELRIYIRAAVEGLNADWYSETVHDFDPPQPTPVQELLSDLRSQIVERANRTCEECGEPGGLHVIDGWYRTCCDKHFQEWQVRKGSK
ncbi:hypothetical protein O9X99_02125 [Agrobacterium salinitolerans]|uniref:Uncharacterized protein n=1 Tax=Agrobacterium salinitolerans TaxID=1183413 RepID=A0ABY3BUS5_9HYPH|nr:MULTISPECIES: hypothetical protein [Agrobacterium]MCZ7890465.1 hypothetical protein [Agrobacterium salinitolerans]TRA96813.1 hypothetical protein EXN23_00830 [Agrobacterium salinitolerans]